MESDGGCGFQLQVLTLAPLPVLGEGEKGTRTFVLH